ncbi:DUF6415 family natural product biosynthesis protein [Streptomyces sp. NPDC026672]|uniref:DUF6415 family natural product biosynthesis protein n=1 Tax=unclassified Streptomyces TaxID=2593676 RepID=UPI0033C3EF06
MRARARRALTEAIPPDDLDSVVTALRGYAQRLIPDVERLAHEEPSGSAPRYAASVCVMTARDRLRLGNGGTLAVRIAVAQKLARAVTALCDHYENLGRQA